jgi:hypothetical protein
MDDKIWKHYEDKRLEAQKLREKIRIEQAQIMPDQKLLYKLYKQLEIAAYTGD